MTTSAPTNREWIVKNLGPARTPSPLALSTRTGDGVPDYVDESRRVLCDIEVVEGRPVDVTRSFEKAGPRALLYFDPARIRAAIVTTGGLCPGINNVIRSIVLHLHHGYGVREVLGYRYGFAGMDPAAGYPPITLGPDEVRHIHVRGGTILGTSRGRRDIATLVSTLERDRIDVLFAVGGDGTMAGAHAIAQEIERSGRQIAVIGVPKTIDNDVAYVDKTFGFETAVSMARLAIDAAHTEAIAVHNGIGLVKLMGREAGFIAANATLASREVNVCLVPEVRFELDGDHGLLRFLDARLAARGHAVIIVAEGCGKFLAEGADAPVDASGNLRFASKELDIGPYLKDRLEDHFAKLGTAIALKYIDPSYMIRGVPADAIDAVFCDRLARNAVHAAMAGKTDMLVGRWHGEFTHVTLPLALSTTKRIDPDRGLWLAVTETTGQPTFLP